jgi:xylulokinase
LRGLSITPHPGSAERAVWAICPTGTAVLNWSRALMGVSIEDLGEALNESDLTPSSVIAVPYLSGAFIYWQGGRKLHGTLLGLTLATSQIDIIRALMESIAYDHVNTLNLLAQEGVKVDKIRAMGGGSRSEWWTQLKSDMMGLPIEVIRQPEAGTLGAALLAGLAIGAFEDLEQTSREFAGTIRSHEPDAKRASLHHEKLEQYHATVEKLLTMS